MTVFETVHISRIASLYFLSDKNSHHLPLIYHADSNVTTLVLDSADICVCLLYWVFNLFVRLHLLLLRFVPHSYSPNLNDSLVSFLSGLPPLPPFLPPFTVRSRTL